MSTEENKRLMQQVFAELALGNTGALIEVLADDVVWHFAGTTKFSKAYKGKDVLINELVKPLFSYVEQLTMTADRIFGDGDYVIVEFRGKATTKSGREYNNRYCMVCRLQDGKITELIEYMDTDHVVKSAGS